MTPDLATCEWHPGSNRSMVDPVAAVARLDVPPATRRVLVEKMRKHQFDDVVSIRWGSITSDGAANAYGPAITNMNFADGRLCRTVTRNKWSADHVEGAITYVVDGRAWGFAAACGNLFELSLAEPAVTRDAVAGYPPESALAIPAGTAEPVYGFQPPPAAALPSLEELRPLGGYATEAFAVGYVGGFVFGGNGGWGGCTCCSTGGVAPALPVPEPSTWALTLFGLLVLAVRRRA